MNFSRKIISAVLLASMVCLPSALLAGEYLPGDFHQHTLYTDGSNKFFDVMDSNVDYGLQWWANSEHGGERNRDGNGNYWDDPAAYPVNPIMGDVETSGGHQEMWRWQSLRDYVYPNILTTRADYPEKTVISGLEWNVPSHEHCSTAILQYEEIQGIDGGLASAISEFEYRFDASDDDTSRNAEASVMTGFGDLSKTNNTRDHAILAVEFMQALKDQGVADAWVVPAHIERARAYTVEDFRNWNNAGSQVAFGFEGAPGHQASGGRGGFSTTAFGGTFGGSGWFCAKVGGLWDALLGEGRNWWNFASSDYHNHWTEGGGDFWPGEYQKNYTYIDTDNPDKLQAVFDGVRSGNSWYVEGDLIDELEFTAHGQGNIKAMMGQTLEVKPGKMVTIKIKAHDPVTPNHCLLDMNNPSLENFGIIQPLNMPVLDHIDLIAGEWGDKIDPSEEETYKNDTNPTTELVATFERNGGIDQNGYLTYVYKFKAEAGKNLYFRLRGTNLPAGVEFETDDDGNPLADSEAAANIYDTLDPAMLAERLFDGVESSTTRLLDVAEAYADLWFYSNPIFIKVVD